MKGNAARESQYQAMISNLSGDIQEDIERVEDQPGRLPEREKGA